MNQFRKLALPLLVVSALLIILGIQYWGYETPALGIDDANIYFVYMKNLANGYGFVWNPGDERVEGFTSLLWTLIGSCIYKISPAHFAFVLAALLFILITCTIIMTLRFVRRLNNATALITYTDLIILACLLLPLGFVEWNILSLMETGLWTFLLTVTFLSVVNIYLTKKTINLFLFSVLIIVIDLTRPESILFNVLFIAFFFITSLSVVNWKKAMVKTIVPSIVHAGTVLSIMKWRLSYFGFAFPNTYYAKVSQSLKDNIAAGASYAFVFFYNYPIAIFIVAILAWFTFKIIIKLVRKELITDHEKVHLSLMAFILTVLALPMLTGGDHFKYNRFYQAMLPLFFATICNKYCWQKYMRISFPSGRAENTVLAVSFFAMLFFSAKYTVFDFIASQRRLLHYPVIQDFIVSKEGREVGDKMNETFSLSGHYPSVGTLATGGFAFVYKGKTIDLMGLNNVRMAHANPYKVGYRNHASFNKSVFYQLMPDMMGTFYGAQIVHDTTGFILPENKPEFRTDYSNMVYGSFKQIYDDVKFRSMYQPALLHRPGSANFIFDYCSVKFLASIDTNTIKVKLLPRNSLSETFAHTDPVNPSMISQNK